jgi:hypothetical protein
MEQVQRTDITKVVEEYSKTAPPVLPTRSPASVATPPSEPKPPKPTPSERHRTSELWYVVVDEIVEGTVTFEAWPWPDVAPTTLFLRFDLNRTINKTVDLVDLQDEINTLRRESDKDSETASRPLRIGDVFRVEASDIETPGAWHRLEDETGNMRREAQAALSAMAAPISPIPPPRPYIEQRPPHKGKGKRPQLRVIHGARQKARAAGSLFFRGSPPDEKPFQVSFVGTAFL